VYYLALFNVTAAYLIKTPIKRVSTASNLSEGAIIPSSHFPFSLFGRQFRWCARLSKRRNVMAAKP
jgi:hypothetical protein